MSLFSFECRAAHCVSFQILNARLLCLGSLYKEYYLFIIDNAMAQVTDILIIPFSSFSRTV